MLKTTIFDPSEHHIYTASYLLDWSGKTHVFRSIVDTGAPTTEFSDEFLYSIGLLQQGPLKNLSISPLEQTKKYGLLKLPQISCLGQTIKEPTVKVSKFAEGWGIDALIGLDFFRKFRVTVDYQKNHILTETYSS